MAPDLASESRMLLPVVDMVLVNSANLAGIWIWSLSELTSPPKAGSPELLVVGCSVPIVSADR